MPKTTERAETSAHSAALYMAMDLGSSIWMLAFGDGQPASKPRMRKIVAGDLEALEVEIRSAKEKLGLSAGCEVRSCYEAGRDGFWPHRALTAHGVDSVVIHPASLDRPRGKQPKTDRIDAAKLLSLLIRYHQGERRVWRVVQVPAEQTEDDRRLVRERIRLSDERTALINTVKAALALHGLKTKWSKAADLDRQLSKLRTAAGQPLPPQASREIRRALLRLRLVEDQIEELLEERRAFVAECRDREVAERIRALMCLVGLGPIGALDLVIEVFTRPFQSVKQVGAFVGLVGTPYQSDRTTREQGISKSGRPALRKLMIQLAWVWVRFQPDSEITRWFHRRFGKGKRHRRIGIVAVARRLLGALWRYVEHGVIPEGARFKQRLPAWAA